MNGDRENWVLAVLGGDLNFTGLRIVRLRLTKKLFLFMILSVLKINLN